MDSPLKLGAKIQNLGTLFYWRGCFQNELHPYYTTSAGFSGRISHGSIADGRIAPGSVLTAVTLVLSSLTESVILAVFTFTERGLPMLMTASVDIDVLKEHYILVGIKNCLYFLQVRLLGGATVSNAGGVPALPVIFSDLLLFGAVSLTFAVELLKLSLLGVGESHPLERIDLLAPFLFICLLLPDVFLTGSGGIGSGLGHCGETDKRHSDESKA